MKEYKFCDNVQELFWIIKNRYHGYSTSEACDKISAFKYTVEASHNNYFVFKLIHSMYTGKYLLSISFPLFPLYRTYLKRAKAGAKAGILFKIEFPIAINLASIYKG